MILMIKYLNVAKCHKLTTKIQIRHQKILIRKINEYIYFKINYKINALKNILQIGT